MLLIYGQEIQKVLGYGRNIEGICICILDALVRKGLI